MKISDGHVRDRCVAFCLATAVVLAFESVAYYTKQAPKRRARAAALIRHSADLLQSPGSDAPGVQPEIRAVLGFLAVCDDRRRAEANRTAVTAAVLLVLAPACGAAFLLRQSPRRMGGAVHELLVVVGGIAVLLACFAAAGRDWRYATPEETIAGVAAAYRAERARTPVTGSASQPPVRPATHYWFPNCGP